MGGYIVTSGIFTCFVASTSFRSRLAGAAWLTAATGLTSIGLMVFVNFATDSDFKWVLATFTLPWAVSPGLYYQEGATAHLSL